MRTLTQTFRFPGSQAADLMRVFAEAPLVGGGSIFGNRSVRSTASDGGVRRINGFEPAPVPLIRFDVEMRLRHSEPEPHVVVEFSQPERKRPYLEGQFVWLMSDAEEKGAVLTEEINTPRALSFVEKPLHGRPFSARRWLFFAGGHARLMKDAVANLRTLLQ